MSPCTHLFSTHPSSNNTPDSTRVCWTRVWVQLESTIAWCKPPLHWNVSLLARGSLLAQNAWLTFMSWHSRQKCPKTFLPWHQHSPWWDGYSARKRRDLGRESREERVVGSWLTILGERKRLACPLPLPQPTPDGDTWPIPLFPLGATPAVPRSHWVKAEGRSFDMLCR